MPTYISHEGLEELKKEFTHRSKITRFEIAERIADAKELGDLSENFEYHEAKEQQALNETRIVNLEGMIHDAVLIEKSHGKSEIALGVTFVALFNGKEKTFSIVGSTEADPLSGKISNESPIGLAFYGKKPGDSVEIETPRGNVTYEVISIQ